MVPSGCPNGALPGAAAIDSWKGSTEIELSCHPREIRMDIIIDS